jgi:hypothetical protein
MQNRNKIRALSAVGLLVLVIAGCAPAKWKELPSALPNVGSGAPVQAPSTQAGVESFVQDTTANKVDILIVNDNSASMDPEQRKMSERFTSFVSELRGIDYRIAMTTTDLESANWNQGGRILPWNGTASRVLTPKTPRAEQIFRDTVARPETIDCQKRNDCPSGNEQPLKAIELAVDQATTANKVFFRAGVDFVVVILSDEDEMSDGTSPKATSADDVVKHVGASLGTTKRFAVHSLVIVPGDAKCKAEQAAQTTSVNAAFYGTHAAALSSLTGGTVNSICDTDYARDLQAISKEVRNLVSSFELHKTPKEDSVTVTFDPLFKTKWLIEGQKIIFDPAPPAGTKIEVKYRY